MRRKRLRHTVDTACAMLCGWRLMNDQQSLTELGSGTLEIDLLTEVCLYNGKEIEPLNIAGEIGTWMKADFQKNRIPETGIISAGLRATFVIRPLAGNRKAPERWRGKPKKFIACDITCECIVKTDEKVYRSQQSDYEEWPENWWATVNGP